MRQGFTKEILFFTQGFGENTDELKESSLEKTLEFFWFVFLGMLNYCVFCVFASVGGWRKKGCEKKEGEASPSSLTSWMVANN